MVCLDRVLTGAAFGGFERKVTDGSQGANYAAPMPRACAIPRGFKSEPGGGRADAGQRMAGNAWLGTLALAETASMPRGALSGRPRQTSGQQQEFDSVDSIESDSSNQILG